MKSDGPWPTSRSRCALPIRLTRHASESHEYVLNARSSEIRCGDRPRRSPLRVAPLYGLAASVMTPFGESGMPGCSLSLRAASSLRLLLQLALEGGQLVLEHSLRLL